MKNPTIQNALSHAGESGQFARDVIALADAMGVKRLAAAQALFKHDQVRFVRNLSQRLKPAERRAYADNIAALLREAQLYRVPFKYSRDFRGFVGDLCRKADYGLRCLDAC